jgi:uncharacterized membrane protein YvbJ
MIGAGPASLKCPVCGAKFRGDATCTRCGTDLTFLMRLAARAYAARQRCREALKMGHLELALKWSAAARRIQLGE